MLLKSIPQTKEDMNHYLESEAIMIALAEKLNEDKEYWGMLGLLYDIDWALTKNTENSLLEFSVSPNLKQKPRFEDNVKEHCLKAKEILKEKGFDEEFIETIQSHGYGFEQIPTLMKKKREKKVEHTLASAETLTGVIYAYALMRGRKISDMDVSGLKKKFKDKKFAANCNREIIQEICEISCLSKSAIDIDTDLQIKEIEQVGISLDEFFALAIEAMAGIKDEIGLE